jgi:hypothetical protein
MAGKAVSTSEVRLKLKPRTLKETAADGGKNSFPLALARVQAVDYAAMTVNLLTLGPGAKKPYSNVPITFPHMGRRSFMGVMPETDDICVIGYSPKESGYTRQPYIVTWLPPGGATLGYNWETAASFDPEELPYTPALAAKTEGLVGRHRHKLRHMDPGNAVISSGQGADLVLDESATLTNRRGNEVILRDQDQALLVRSLQQFHAGAGFRVYGGMVQRDARLLPRQLFNDGKDWASARQRDGEGNTVGEGNLPDLDTPFGLTPDPVFQRKEGGSSVSGVAYGANLDPFVLLNRGLFVDSDGNLYDEPPVSSAVYGGKPFYRVARGSGENAAVADAADAGTLTEYRIEVTHTSDGTLPVSEQTDGFDLDRLPLSPGTASNPAAASPNAPFVEFVLGTVVGNDPFGSENGLYSQPLAAQVFNGDKVDPSLVESATLTDERLLSQLAALLRVRNPEDASQQSFMGVTKGGGLRLAVQDAEVSFANGLRLDTGAGPFDFSSQQSVALRSAAGRDTDNVGVEVSSAQGGVLVRAGGAITQATSAAAPPGLLLDSATNTSLTANGTVTVSGNTVVVNNSNQVNVKASTGVSIEGGNSLNMSANAVVLNSMGRADFTFSGPKNSLPTNGPARNTVFVTPLLAGQTADQYKLPFGNLTEFFGTGSARRFFGPGSQTTVTTSGAIQSVVGPFTSFVDVNPVTGSLFAPVTQVVATAGSATLSGTAAALVSSSTNVSLTAPSITLLAGAGPIGGGVLTDGCVDGFTGFPFIAGGTFGVPQVRVV